MTIPRTAERAMEDQISALISFAINFGDLVHLMFFNQERGAPYLGIRCHKRLRRPTAGRNGPLL
jgi:hypothetical protein